MIKVDLSGAAGFWGDKGPDWAECEKAHRTLAERSGAGADFTGWLELPDRMLSGELPRIEAAAARIRAKGAPHGISSAAKGTESSCCSPARGFLPWPYATLSSAWATGISASTWSPNPVPLWSLPWVSAFSRIF